MDENLSSCINGTLPARTMAYRSTAPDPASSSKHHCTISRQEMSKNYPRVRFVHECMFIEITLESINPPILSNLAPHSKGSTETGKI